MGKSRIRDPVPFWPLDPGSGMGRKSASGSGIRDEQPGSYFLELRNHFLGLKYFNSLIRIRDGDSSDPGWKKVGSGINITDPQHCIIRKKQGDRLLFIEKIREAIVMWSHLIDVSHFTLRSSCWVRRFPAHIRNWWKCQNINYGLGRMFRRKAVWIDHLSVTRDANKIWLFPPPSCAF